MPNLQSETMHDARAAGITAGVHVPQKGGPVGSILQAVTNMAKNFVAKYKRPGHDGRAVANYLLRCAKEKGIPVSAAGLAKLVIVSHGWMLGLHHRPLVRDRTVTTPIGPMIWSVYRAFAKQGLYLNQVCTKVKDVDFTEEERKVMDEVFLQYGRITAHDFVRLLTGRGVPWDQVRHYGNFLTIPDAITREYYYKLAARNRKKQ